MPDARLLGTTCKSIVASLEEGLAANGDAYFEVSLLLHEGDIKEALKLLRDMARRDNMTLRALTFMRADKLHESENIIIDARLKRKTP